MKKLVVYVTMITLLFTIVSCGSKPSEIDGIKELEKTYNNLARVVNFRKTDGKLTEFKGVKGYEMEYEAEIEFLADVFDGSVENNKVDNKKILRRKDERKQIKGIISFEKTEKGWRGCSSLVDRGIKACSLSVRTRKIIDKVEKPIIIYILFVVPQDEIIADVQRMMNDLLEEYKVYSGGKIFVEKITWANPEMVEILQKKLKLDTIAPNDMILYSGDNQKNINLVETYEQEYNQSGRSGGLKAFKGEESLTSAIMTIIKKQKTILYFTTGHNEGDTKNQSPDGFTTFANYLQRENIEIKQLNLLEITEIPRDCSALIVMGPKNTITAPERNLINNYLKSGGRALISIDPLADTGLADFLTEWGMKISDGIVLDPEKCVAFLGRKDVTCLAVDTYGNHPITNKMRGEMSILPGARAIDIISPTMTTELLKSSANSWLEINMDDFAKNKAKFDKDTDRKGAINLGVAVTQKEGDKETRIVVIGDSDMVRNKFIDADSVMGFGKVDLMLNSIRWLIEENNND